MKGESFFALVAGVLAGTALGVLFAPDKGEVTRSKIKKTALDSYDDLKENTAELAKKAKKHADKVQEDILKLKDTLVQYGSDMKEDARDKILKQLNNLEEALSKNED